MARPRKVQELDEPHLEAWRSFLRAHARLTEVLEHELSRDTGLPLVWYDVLIQLHHAGGRLRMHDLARAVLLSRAGLTRLVDRISAAGFVEREPCPDDRRGTFVILTEKGAERLDEARPFHHSGIQEHFGRHVSLREAATLRRVFDRVLRSLEP